MKQRDVNIPVASWRCFSRVFDITASISFATFICFLVDLRKQRPKNSIDADLNRNCRLRNYFSGNDYFLVAQ